VGAAQPRRDREHIRDLADEKLAAKAAEVGEEDWKTVERLVLIRTIDSLWVEHLTELDDMRRGIGPARLRPAGPAQRVQARGLPALRRACAADPPRRRQLDLPGDRHPPASAGRRRRHRRWRGARPGSGVAERRERREWRQRPGCRHGRRRRHGGRKVPAAAAVGGSAILRGGPPGSPDDLDRCARRSAISRSPAREPGRLRARAGRNPVHPERRADRPQRSLLVRFGREVQEVSRR
jgi:hypothetical protein